MTVAVVTAGVLAILLSALVKSGGPAVDAATTRPGALFPSTTIPRTASQLDDTAAVELGVKFTTSVATTVLGARFYKGAGNTGTHKATLWSASGRRLATVTFVNETATGWQTASFSPSIRIAAGQEYTISYTAPHGRYAGDEGGFATPLTRSGLTVAPGGGVYTYVPGTFPRSSYRDANYYVDVVVGVSLPRLPLPPAPTPSDTVRPITLPRIAWEGGPTYWKQFPKTAAGGWTNPSFFPIVAWWGGISTNAEVAFDKSLGINTYVEMYPGTPYRLFGDNNVYWIGGKLNNTFTSTSKNWVGTFLGDEVDGRYNPVDGRAYLQSESDTIGEDGRFKYANFTQQVIGGDMGRSDAQRYLNDYTDVLSVDMYWYTIPFCDWDPYRGEMYEVPILQSNCRTASSYGKLMESLRTRDAIDGKLQPLWQFVENLSGAPGPPSPALYINPGQLKGAVMSSVINEARGIVYFNQSLSGNCQGGNIFRQAQVVVGFCGAAQVAAAGVVNNQIRVMAPVLNTQSYEYRFGPGLDTMMKADAKYVYVFAMVDGASKPGTRTFQLPAEVSGRTVEVMFENRSRSATAAGSFTDTFTNEYSYHIYRVKR